MTKLSDLDIDLRISIQNPNSKSHSVFGRGIAMLCAGVQKSGSLNASAKDLGMAYSKAWRIIKDTEVALGFALLHRDGPRGSSLTPEAIKLIKAYEEIEEELANNASKLLSLKLP